MRKYFYQGIIFFLVITVAALGVNLLSHKEPKIIKDLRMDIAIVKIKLSNEKLINKKLKDSHKWGYILEQIMPSCVGEEWNLLNKQIKEWEIRYGWSDNKG